MSLPSRGSRSRALLSYAALFARSDLRAESMPAHLDFATCVLRAPPPPRQRPRRPPPVRPRRRRPSGDCRVSGSRRSSRPWPRSTTRRGPRSRPTASWSGEAISANFSGSYTAGPGRFNNQAMTINLVAFGGANFSYHTNLTGVLYTPADPATSSAVGMITLFPAQRPHVGCPVHLRPDRDRQRQAWASERVHHGDRPGRSRAALRFPRAQVLGGPLTSYSGIVNIHYFPESSHNGTSSGKFYLTLRALQYTSGTINPIAVPGNRPGPGALTPQRLSTLGTGR